MGPRTAIAVHALLLSLCVSAEAKAQQAVPDTPSPPAALDEPEPTPGPAADPAGPAPAEDSPSSPDDGQPPAHDEPSTPAQEEQPGGGDVPPAPTETGAQAEDGIAAAPDTTVIAAPEQPATDAPGALPQPPTPDPDPGPTITVDSAATAQPPQSPQPPDDAPANEPGAPDFEPNWRGSGLAWSHSVAYGTFDRSLQPSYNPGYAWAFDAVLRWNFQPKLSARIIQSANIELTDSDFTTEGQQLLFSDTRLRTDYRVGTLALTEHQNLTLMVRGTLVVPTSKASQAATLTAATVGRATLIWSVDEPLSGVSVIGGSSFRKNWNRDTTVVVDEVFPCTTAGSSAGSVDCRNGTLANVDWGSTALAVVNLQITPAISAALAYAHTWNRTYSLPAATIELLSGPETFGEADQYRFRNTQLLDLTASYMPGQWWTLSVSLTNQFVELGPDGKPRGPFDPQDLYLGVSIFVTPPPPSSGQTQNLLNPINQ